MTNYQHQLTNHYTEDFFEAVRPIPTITVFILAKNLLNKIKLSSKIEKLIVVLGSCSFGIYLLDNGLRRETLFIYEALEEILPTFVACILWLVIVYLIGCILVLCLKRIPGIRKLI